MRGEPDLVVERYDDISERLAAEFDGVVSPAAVRAVVRAAELELRGQVPAGSLDEMLHRLAGYRLREQGGEGAPSARSGGLGGVLPEPRADAGSSGSS